MADQTYGYPYNNNRSHYSSSYHPRSEHSSDDEYKHPYDNEIIESYATAEVSLPGHQPNLPYPPGVHSQANLMDTQTPATYYPPSAAKPSYSSATTYADNSDYQSPTSKDGGGGFGLSAVQEKQENRSFWQTVSCLTTCRRYITVSNNASLGAPGFNGVSALCLDRFH
jgi:hypothetical protein